MTVHYYRLGGRSLQALEGLIAKDRQDNGDFFRSSGPAPATDGSIRQEFSKAQITGWQRDPGFHKPAVTVRSYEGHLYRAYHKFPQMATSPGTAKKNFGLADFFKKPVNDSDGKRIVIYTAYEDYKGRHFAPPDAVKLDDEEFGSYQVPYL